MSIFAYMNEIQKKILADTSHHIQRIFEDDSTGHDWWHIYRVKNLALKIAEPEGGDVFIIEMAALLHDLDDWKLSGNSETNLAKDWLEQVEVEKPDRLKILQIIDEVSFKGAGVETIATSLESKIVQDADRLDAIGAVGIARTFAYGGNKGRLIYDPKVAPERHNDFESYKNNSAPTINHFYEKLLLLKDRLNTNAAKNIASKRHDFMEKFLTQFFSEWNNKF